MALYDMLSEIDPRSYSILTSLTNILYTLENWVGRGAWLPCKYFFYDRPRETSFSRSKSERLSSIFSRNWNGKLFRLGRVPILSFIVSILQISLVVTKMVLVGVRVTQTEKITEILGTSDTGPALFASYLVSRLTRKPYALYLFDIYLGNRLPPAHHLLAMLFEGTLVKHASVVIVTNENAGRLYRKRYGEKLKFAIVHNSVASTRYSRKRSAYSPVPPYSIVFTGLIYWAQRRSISNLVRAMSHLTMIPVRLDLYVPNADVRLKRLVRKYRNVRLLAADREKMPTVQSEATVLFLPFSWKTANPDVIMTASPGKLTDYLASGRPILIHAPPGAYVNNYARRNNFAVVVDEEDTESLAGAVRSLISDEQLARQLIRNAIRTFQRNHTALASARKFAQALG